MIKTHHILKLTDLQRYATKNLFKRRLRDENYQVFEYIVFGKE